MEAGNTFENVQVVSEDDDLTARFHRALWQAGQSVRAAIEAAQDSDDPQVNEAWKELAGIRDQIDDIASPEAPNEVALTDAEAIAALAAMELCWNMPGTTRVAPLATAYRKLYNAYCCVGPTGRPGPGRAPRELT